MTPGETPAPTLIFTYGNPSRGDDALGPLLYERLESEKRINKLLQRVDLLTDFQLQIEHAMDLQNRERIIFVDASVSAAAPFEYSRLTPAREISYTTHAMSPAEVLSVYQQINGKALPPAFLLGIRGYEFALGQPLTSQAEGNLQLACEFILELLANYTSSRPAGIC